MFFAGTRISCYLLDNIDSIHFITSKIIRTMICTVIALYRVIILYPFQYSHVALFFGKKCSIKVPRRFVKCTETL